jgi:capsular polysaccharide biosynthesis protein
MQGNSNGWIEMSLNAIKRKIHNWVKAERPNLYGLLALKQELVDAYGMQEAADIFCQAAGWGNATRIRPLAVRPLREYAQKHADYFEEISPSQLKGCPAIRGAEGDVVRAKVVKTRPMYFCVLKDAVVASKSDLIVCDDSALLDSEPEELDRLPLNLSVNAPVISHQDKTAWVVEPEDENPNSLHLAAALSLLGVHSFNFGHWMMEFLPRVWLAMNRPGFSDVPVLVDNQMPHQNIEALKFFIGDAHPVRVIQPGQKVTVGRLWASPMFRYCPAGADPKVVNKEGFVQLPLDAQLFTQLFRGALAAAPAKVPASPYKYVYLTRKNLHKQLINQEEIENYMRALGFELFDFYELPFLSQVSIIQNASILAGPEGSAFSNICFGRGGLKVVQLTSPFVDGYEFYSQLAEAWGLEVYLLKGEYAGAQSEYQFHSDYRVSVDQLKKIMKRLMPESQT